MATTTDGIQPKISITINVPPCVAQALKGVVTSEKAHPRRAKLNQVVKSVTSTTSIVIVPFMLMNLYVKNEKIHNRKNIAIVIHNILFYVPS